MPNDELPEIQPALHDPQRHDLEKPAPAACPKCGGRVVSATLSATKKLDFARCTQCPWHITSTGQHRSKAPKPQLPQQDLDGSVPPKPRAKPRPVSARARKFGPRG